MFIQRERWRGKFSLLNSALPSLSVSLSLCLYLFLSLSFSFLLIPNWCCLLAKSNKNLVESRDLTKVWHAVTVPLTRWSSISKLFDLICIQGSCTSSNGGRISAIIQFISLLSLSLSLDAFDLYQWSMMVALDVAYLPRRHIDDFLTGQCWIVVCADCELVAIKFLRSISFINCSIGVGQLVGLNRSNCPNELDLSWLRKLPAQCGFIGSRPERLRNQRSAVTRHHGVIRGWFYFIFLSFCLFLQDLDVYSWIVAIFVNEWNGSNRMNEYSTPIMERSR